MSFSKPCYVKYYFCTNTYNLIDLKYVEQKEKLAIKINQHLHLSTEQSLAYQTCESSLLIRASFSIEATRFYNH